MEYWGDWFLGLISYQRNELEAAAVHFTKIFEHPYIAQISPFRDAVAALALIHQIKGESAEAWQMVETISRYDMEQRGNEDERTRSLRARLMLMQGNLEGSINWVNTFTDPPPDQAFLWLEEPQVTRARILAATGKGADLRSALQILDALGELVERTHNTRHKIEILALRALALDALGETGAANAALMQALDLSWTGGFIRVFIDLGKPMQEMLSRLAEQGHSVETIRRILAGFAEDNHNQPSSESPAQPRPHASHRNSTLLEPLTPRELEVLTLLRGPSSIKEIAHQLHISYATARRHTINLYGKLDVNQRWKAVARAEELNILPPR